MERYRDDISKDKLFEEARRIELIGTTIFVETKEGWKYVITKDKVELVDEFPEIGPVPEVPEVAPTKICAAYKYYEDTKQGVLSYYQSEEKAIANGADKIWPNVEEMTFNVSWNEKTGTFPPWIEAQKNGEIGSIDRVIVEEVIAPESTEYYFYGLNNIEKIERIENLKTNNATSMKKMFWRCDNLKELDLSGFNTTNVTNMDSMFHSCANLQGSNLKGLWRLNTSKVTNMPGMFSSCTKLKSLDLSNFNTEQVTNMGQMFNDCKSLENIEGINNPHFKTNKVMAMNGMFTACHKITNLDLSNFETQNVEKMQYMFSQCWALRNLNMTNFSTNKVIEYEHMFDEMPKEVTMTTNQSMKNWIIMNFPKMNSYNITIE